MCPVHGWDAPCHCGYALAAGLLLAGCALFSSPPPDTAARDAHQAELAACKAYDLLPADQHNAKADKLCRTIRLECTDVGAGGSP